MRNISDKSCKKIKTHFMFSNIFFFRKSFRLWDNVEKYCWTRQATDENMAHAYCIRLQTHIQNKQYLLLCHSSGYKNSPQYYVIIHYMSFNLRKKAMYVFSKAYPILRHATSYTCMCDRSSVHYLSCADCGIRWVCVVKEILILRSGTIKRTYFVGPSGHAI